MAKVQGRTQTVRVTQPRGRDSGWEKLGWLVIAAAVGFFSAGIAALVAVKVDGTRTEARLDAVESRTVALEKSTDGLPAAVARIGQLVEEMAKLNRAIERMHEDRYTPSQAAELSGRVGGVQTSVSDIDRRLVRVETELRAAEVRRANFGTP